MYINTTTFEQLTEQGIRDQNPNTSYPNPFLEPEGYAFIFPVPQPAYDAQTQVVREVPPILTPKGHWEQQWEVLPRFTEYTDEAGRVHSVEEQLAALQEAERKSRVPTQVTMRQARLALLAAGLLDDVEGAISTAGPAAKIEWEYAQEVQRNWGLVPAMATALGIADLQLDELFIAAATL